ncbi:hypothetical protein N0V88_006422 [Collariella sp. IMI 366227]|nr:hypothetical protein N0V88_006422 [Collariella sp. IMI 366227]
MARNECDRSVLTGRSTKDLYHYAAKKLAEPNTPAEEKATREKERKQRKGKANKLVSLGPELSFAPRNQYRQR